MRNYVCPLSDLCTLHLHYKAIEIRDFPGVLYHYSKITKATKHELVLVMGTEEVD